MRQTPNALLKTTQQQRPKLSQTQNLTTKPFINYISTKAHQSKMGDE
jgi:hypothetical protein